MTMAATGTAKAPHSARGESGKLLGRIEKVHREGIAIDSLSSASKEILSILSFVILRTLLSQGAHYLTLPMPEGRGFLIHPAAAPELESYTLSRRRIDSGVSHPIIEYMD